MLDDVGVEIIDDLPQSSCPRSADDRLGLLLVRTNHLAGVVVTGDARAIHLRHSSVDQNVTDADGRRIINQASGAAYNYVSPFRPETFNGMGTFNYQISKWGVVGLTKYMAGALGTWNITVNCIAPGVIDTEATRKAVPAAAIEMLAKQQPFPGVLNPEDLTGAAVYFASDESRFVTGQVLVIDGGKHMPA